MQEITAGAKANLNGKIFEDMCKPIFINHGYKIFKESEIERNPSLIDGVDKYVISNAKYLSIYNHIGRTEFVIVKGERRVRVENKYQAASGSVDEKFVYTLLNAIEAYPEKEAIIIIDGDGYKPGARKWVEDRINENWLDYNKHIDIKLMRIVEFLQWFTKEMA